MAGSTKWLGFNFDHVFFPHNIFGSKPKHCKKDIKNITPTLPFPEAVK